MKLDAHDVKVIAFHAIVAVIQYALIGFKVENPQYALAAQTVLEALRRLAF